MAQNNVIDFKKKFFEKKLKIDKADDSDVLKYKEEIRKILMAMGYRTAMVTNESCFSDFYWNYKGKEKEDKEEELSKLLGVKIHLSDYLVNVAEKMHNSKSV